jgi:aspartate/methionine/tyrosine aminotransferase
LYNLHESLLAEDVSIVDLVKGNVNEHGIAYPEDLLASILAKAVRPARVYHPDSFGQRPAREAIAAYYGALKIPANRILITPGTSVSYWYCFKLLAEPDDEILCPQPSYPLFDYIARLCGVRLTYYRLNEARGWAIDLDSLENRITTRTRAIVLISPHNPTGMVADDAQLQGMAEIAARHSLPIISDEVFSEFLFDVESLPRPAATMAPLVFTLNGLSKMMALPGMKIGWIAVSGDPTVVQKSMSALEMISDTFLPVNEIAQFAVPDIFEAGRDFQLHYRSWIRRCRDAALAGLRGLSFVAPRGGFYVTIPTNRDEGEAAAELLKHRHILTHPGYYYDIRPDHLVTTFIGDPVRLEGYFREIASVIEG